MYQADKPRWNARVAANTRARSLRLAGLAEADACAICGAQPGTRRVGFYAKTVGALKSKRLAIDHDRDRDISRASLRPL